NPYIERHLAIFVNCFCLERTNQLSLLPDKDLVDLCPPIEPYQVTKNPVYFFWSNSCPPFWFLRTRQKHGNRPPIIAKKTAPSGIRSCQLERVVRGASVALHYIVVERLKADPNYRPRNLAPLLNNLLP
ncbi:MAG: hypothetical protein ACK552_08455, partial [Microcystis sp.]